MVKFEGFENQAAIKKKNEARKKLRLDLGVDKDLEKKQREAMENYIKNNDDSKDKKSLDEIQGEAMKHFIKENNKSKEEVISDEDILDVLQQARKDEPKQEKLEVIKEEENQSAIDVLQEAKVGSENEIKEDQSERISNINNKDELINFLDSIDGIKGSSDDTFYKSEDLKNLAEKLFFAGISSEKALSGFPITNGFRNKVKEILDKTIGNEGREMDEMKDGKKENAENNPDNGKVLDLEKDIGGTWKMEKTEDEELEKLLSEVGKARLSYAKKDYETTSLVSKITRVLGKSAKINPEELQDVKDSYENYKKKHDDLLKYKIDKLRENKNLSKEELDQEIEALVKFYTCDEKTNLFEAHTNVCSELWEEKFGKASGYISKKAGKLINSYRKANWKKKLLISGALVAGGFIAAYGASAGAVGAGAAASIFSSAQFVKRGLSAAATGVGMTGALEAEYRKKEQEEQQKRGEYIKGNFEAHEGEYKFNALMDHLQREVSGYDQRLKIEKKQATRRKLFGATFGVAVGMFAGEAMRNVGRGIMDTEVMQIAKNFYSGKADEIMASASPQTREIVNTVLEKIGFRKSFQAPIEEANASAGDIKEVLTPKIGEGGIGKSEIAEMVSGKNVETLIVSKGGNFTGVVAGRLQEMGLDHDKAVKAAYRMYEEYSANHPDPTGRGYNIIQPGSKIELGFDENSQLKIVSFEDGSKVSGVASELEKASPKTSIKPETNGGASMVINEAQKSQEVFHDKESVRVQNNSIETPVEESVSAKSVVDHSDDKVNANAVENIEAQGKTSAEFSKLTSEQIEKSKEWAKGQKTEDLFMYVNAIKNGGVPGNPEALRVSNMAAINELVSRGEMEAPKFGVGTSIDDVKNVSNTPDGSVTTNNRVEMRSDVIKLGDKIKINSEGKKVLGTMQESLKKSINKPLIEKEYNQQIAVRGINKVRLAQIENIINNPKNINVVYGEDGSIDYKGFTVNEATGRKAYYNCSVKSNGSVSTFNITENEYNAGTPLNQIENKSLGANLTEKSDASLNLENIKEKYGYDTGENIDKIERARGLARGVIKELSMGNNNNLKIIGGVKFDDLSQENGVDSSLVENTKRVEKDIVSFLGDEAKHRENETVKEWTSRIYKMSISK